MIHVRYIVTLLLYLIMGFGHLHSVEISTLSNNDPLPLYYTHTPHDYLTAQMKRACRQPCIDQPCYDDQRPYDRFLFSFGGFYQKATRGRNWQNQRVPLGDIAGRWNMLALTYGCVPPGFDLNDAVQFEQLKIAKQTIWSDIPGVTLPEPGDANTPIPEPDQLLDPHKQVGFYSVPMKYQKTGARFAMEFALMPCGELGLGIYGGAATIKQTLHQELRTSFTCTPEGCYVNPSGFVNLTPENVTGPECPAGTIPRNSTPPPTIIPNGFFDLVTTGTYQKPRICVINDELMLQEKAENIFKEIGQDPCNFKHLSLEDLHVILWWRHLIRVNPCHDPCYASFTIIPFITLQGTMPLADKKDRTQLFSLPFGNDGHGSIGALAGLSIDFHETLEIGFSGGITHFFGHDFELFRVPTDDEQSGIYPFYTDVHRNPGLNVRFDAYLTAHHFICLLSAWVQYAFVCHDEDHIDLLNPADLLDREGNSPGCYMPGVLECNTKWETHVLNTGATYDISPNIALGVVVQWPLMQRNAYRSTTVMGTFQVEF